MECAETAVVDGERAGHGATGEPSVSSSLEHLVAGSQGVITKRIDLALLEGQELLSRTLQRAALVGVGMVLAAAAWFAVAACLVLFATPDAEPGRSLGRLRVAQWRRCGRARRARHATRSAADTGARERQWVQHRSVNR